MKPCGYHPVEAESNVVAAATGPPGSWGWLWKKSHVRPFWLAHAFDNRLRSVIHPAGRILGGHLAPGMTALDVGCGMGYFSLALARLVGRAGKVLAADIQPGMLDKTVSRAARAGLAGRIRPLLLDGSGLNLDRGIDFALAFWMAHEAEDLPLLLGRIHHHLSPGGRFLLVEPLLHVSKRRFALETVLAMETGLRILSEPSVRFSRAVVFEKP